ncbi:MAG: hypothetical protein A2Y24_07205 [Clostridiales bacterium GWE2_32_10]|nr:MAG: hypothetical protein A2Y24_07205 [Clostridiales bacterium GWE2_32_10]
MNFAAEKDCYIVVDAIFEESPNAKRIFQAFKNSSNYYKLIKLKGLSKDTPQLTDLRLGWSICKNQYFNERLLTLSEVTNFSNSTFLESLATIDLQNRVWADNQVNNEYVNIYKNEKDLYHRKIKAGLDRGIKIFEQSKIVDKVISPDAGNILFVKISDSVKSKINVKNDHDMFVYVLEKANILITPGHVFGISSDELWFRITMSKSIENFEAGINKLLTVLEGDYVI